MRKTKELKHTRTGQADPPPCSLLTISTCRGSRLVGAAAGTANWIFLLSLGSTSTSLVGREASMSPHSQREATGHGEKIPSLPSRRTHTLSLLPSLSLSLTLSSKLCEHTFLLCLFNVSPSTLPSSHQLLLLSRSTTAAAAAATPPFSRSLSFSSSLLCLSLTRFSQPAQQLE